MEENVCQIVPTTMVEKRIGDWKTIVISGGLILLFCILSYFLFRFIQHTNKRMKSIEQAFHNLNQNINDREKSRTMGHHPPPAPLPPQQHFFMHQDPIIRPSPVVAPAPSPPPPTVVVDSKTLDKELSDELKELVDTVVEGRVEEETPATN